MNLWVGGSSGGTGLHLLGFPLGKGENHIKAWYSIGIREQALNVGFCSSHFCYVSGYPC